MKGKIYMNKNKILTAVMAGTMMMGSVLPVCAASTVTNHAPISQEEIGDKGTERDTEVLYNEASTFSVIIPKQIVLGEEKTSDYDVKVSGDISSDKQVKVAPDANFVMKDQGTVAALRKNDVTATVTQAEKIWTSAQVCVEDGTTKKGNVSAEDLTSGSWKGTFTFNIALEAAE